MSSPHGLDSLPDHPFGALLRQLRKKRGWNQTELGLRVHRDFSTISKIERGTAPCPHDLAELFAKAFGLSGIDEQDFLDLAGLDVALRETTVHEVAWDSAAGEALRLAERLGIQLPGLGRGTHTIRTAALLESGEDANSARPPVDRPNIAPRLRTDVISRLVERYRQPRFFNEVEALGGDMLTEGQNVYPVAFFPAIPGYSLAAVLPLENVDAREAAVVREDELAVRDPGPRLRRWMAANPTGTEAEAHRNTAWGWNFCMRDLLPGDGHPTLTARLGAYGQILDSCDALIDEAFADPTRDKWPNRDGVDQAEGNPLLQARHRAAGIGIAAVIVCVGEYPDGTRRLDALIGRRSRAVGTYPDTWHVAPAGMFNWRFGPTEPDGSAARPWGSYESEDLLRAVLTEYAEEAHNVSGLETNRDRPTLADISVVQDLVAVARIEVTGVALDLANLRPEVCVLIFVEDPAWLPRQRWKLNYEYSGYGQPTGQTDSQEQADFTVITVMVGEEELNDSALRRLDPEETVAAGAASFWLGVRRARQLFTQSLAAD